MKQTIRSLGLGLIVVSALAALVPRALAVNPCCAITAIDQGTGIVTARENASGKTFQFKASADTLKTLHVGQSIDADFNGGRVGPPGEAPCCGIVSPLK